MATIVNRNSVLIERKPGGSRQRLIDDSLVKGSTFYLDVLTVSPGGCMDISTENTGIFFGQVLEGAGKLEVSGEEYLLTDSHVFFLPPGTNSRLCSEHGVTLLAIAVPNAVQFDSMLTSRGLQPCCIDAAKEPVLKSEHDDRTRIYLVTEHLFGTTALMGEIIGFPPGVVSANHHHEGTDHFMYILGGQGVMYLNEQTHQIRADDMLYIPDLERHYCVNNSSEKLTFVEFFLPGEYKTVWENPDISCAWNPTGKNSRGGEPAREIRPHVSDGTIYSDV
jgi:quercetin dioxygenase-like cupin family protein